MLSLSKREEYSIALGLMHIVNSAPEGIERETSSHGHKSDGGQERESIA
jgi:hypothetical protein